MVLTSIFFTANFDPSKFDLTGGFIFWAVVSIISIVIIYLISKFFCQAKDFKKASKQGGEISYIDFKDTMVATRIGNENSHNSNNFHYDTSMVDRTNPMSTAKENWDMGDAEEEYDEQNHDQQDKFVEYMKMMAAQIGKQLIF